jgi:hypothetical protein
MEVSKQDPALRLLEASFNTQIQEEQGRLIQSCDGITLAFELCYLVASGAGNMSCGGHKGI